MLFLTTLFRQRGWIAFFALLTPSLARAQTASPGAINLASYISDTLIPAFNVLLLPVAIVAIVIMAMILLMSTDEGALGKARTGIGIVIGGVMFAELSPVIVRIFSGSYGGGFGIFGIGSLPQEFVIQVLGIKGFVETFAVVVAVGVIIGSCLRAILSFGDEANYTNARRSLFHAVAGIVVLLLIPAIENALFVNRTSNGLLVFIFLVMKFILGFITLIMVAIIIYAGVLLILNFISEQNIDRAKGIILRTIIGLVLVLFSLALVQFVLTVFS